MTDNIDIDPGVSAGKKSVRTDEVAGVHYQVIKVAIGAPDSATDVVGGAGAVGAGVLRVTLANDDVLVTAFSTGIALKAGSAVVGKFSIDQTTDGTTNLVAAKQSGTWNVVNSAGANIIGKVGIDQTTDGATNKVAADLRLGGTAVAAGAGVVGTGTPRVTLASDDPGVAALVAIRDATNTVNTADDSSVIYVGTSAKTPKFKSLDATASGATEVVALVSSKKIRVVALVCNTDADVNIKLVSHTTTATKTSLKLLKAGGGWVLGYCPAGWFETVAGEALDINLSGAANVGIDVVYIEV